MKKISLIRHAQSVANAWLPTSDPATVMLTDLWREQARLLAANRTDEIDLILYSQYTRTQETAKPMIEKFPQVTVLQNPFIHEFTYLDPKQCINTTGDQRRFLRERFWMNDDVFYQDGQVLKVFINCLWECVFLLTMYQNCLIIILSHLVTDNTLECSLLSYRIQIKSMQKMMYIVSYMKQKMCIIVELLLWSLIPLYHNILF